jgi:hypothetical protein
MGSNRATGDGLPQGFDPPSSNTTWCPNQFFDVVLPHFPRGVVRLVGYLLWQTLAWNDEGGQPVETRHRLTWQTLGARARVSRGALGAALAEALRARLIRRVAPEPDDATVPAFELRWADEGPYVRVPKAFPGFFSGRGHRTYVPNQLFTVVVAHEPLAVVRVVGAIVRHSIGFEAEQGYRRTEAALSSRALARLTNLSLRQVTRALAAAIAAGYLRQVDPGQFGRAASCARYAVRWSDGFDGAVASSRFRNVHSTPGSPGGSKLSTGTVQKCPQRQFKNVHSCKEEIKPLPNKTSSKPQPADAAEPDRDAVRRRLREMGFAGKSIEALAQFPLARIERQIAWLEGRSATRSPLGLLRRAIEEDWPPPQTVRRKSAAVVNVALPSSSAVPPPEPSAAQRRAYGAWMLEQLDALKRSEPVRYQAFLEHRERIKASLRYVHRDRPDHGILRGWDSEAARIAHLQAFDRTLPDLDTWCRRPSPAAVQCPAPSETRAAMKNSQIAT